MHYYNNILLKFNEQEFKAYKMGLKIDSFFNFKYLSENEIGQILYDFYIQRSEYYNYNPESGKWSSFLPSRNSNGLQWEWRHGGGNWSVGQTVKELIYNHFSISIVGCRSEDGEDLHCDLARLVRCLQSDDFIDFIVGLIIENFYTQADGSKPAVKDYIVRAPESVGISNTFPTIPNENGVNRI